MNSLSGQVTFASLPSNVIGNILHQLNLNTGSKGIINQSDIPVVLRYAKSLACTCKTLAEKVNEASVVEFFLESLSKKYDHKKEHFAALLNTPGAREWLWKYIKHKGDDKVYQVIQDIFLQTKGIISECMVSGVGDEFPMEILECQEPFPSFGQTVQGFAFGISWSPTYLYTPLGALIIQNGGGLERSELFINLFKATFLQLDNSQPDGGYKRSLYEISASHANTIREIKNKDMVQINEDELKTKTGTHNLVVSNFCGNVSTYIISEANGEKLPEVVFHTQRKTFRSKETIEMIWKMLRAKEGKHLIAHEKKLYDLSPKNLLEEFNKKDFSASCILDSNNKMKSIGQNWKESLLKDHPTLLHTESEEDYKLFVKLENNLPNEDRTIRNLAYQLDLQDYISCHAFWTNDQKGTYLWIRKVGLNKVLEILNISLTEGLCSQ